MPARPGLRQLAWLVLCLLWLAPPPATAQQRFEVLLLFDEDNDLPGLATINRNLRQSLRAAFGDDIGFYTESLQLSQFRNPDFDSAVTDFLRRKYQDKNLDLVIAVMEPSLDYLLRHRDQVFAGVPVLFCGVDTSDVDIGALPPGITGVMMQRRFAPTLDTALKLQPDMRQLFVVGGTSRFDQKILAIARRDLEGFGARVSINWLTSLPMDDLLEKLSSLPANSAVYFISLFADGDGQAFVTHDALRRITQVANVPVYVSVDQYIGSGAVGGNVYSVASLGTEAAQVAVRILRGEAPSKIPPLALSPYVPMFDWRQLQRWNIDMDRLPAGSVLQERKFTVWESYSRYIVGGVSLFLLQSALVLALLLNRARRQRAELARQESDLRRRRAEEEAQRQRDELAHALRLTTLGELTASIAHELNQPLTAIAANAQAAYRLLHSDRANPDLEEALEDLENDSIRAAEIIQRLQVLFRKKPGTQAPLDINAVIDDVLHLLGGDLRQRQIEVNFARCNPAPKVMGDSVQMRQVILNLLRNAEEAIALAKQGPREVVITIRKPDSATLVIEIRDSGIGVEETELERMFEHFVSSKPQGLGMGLAISRSIVEAHGGRIWASRNQDRGITLHVQLPVAAAVA